MAAALRSYNRRRNVSSETPVIARRPRSLNNLPDEILQKIFSHIGPEELCLIIPKVCERWNNLTKDVVLWKTLSYECDVSSDISSIEEVLTAAPALQSLIIRKREDAAHILEFLFHKPRDLRKLTLKHCWLGDDGTRLLANIVEFYPAVEALTLADSRQLTRVSYALIPRLKKISELHLTDYEVLSGTAVRLIADSCQNLKKLSLNCFVQIDDDDIVHVITKLGKQLTFLVLDGEYLTDVVYLYLKNCARLQELKVFPCYKMTDRGLLEGIGTHLRLNFSRNLTAQALSTFLHRPSMNYIVSLDLSGCSNLDDEGLKVIAERCIHLKELVVSACSCVTDAGISMVVRHCNQLRVLDLSCLPSITGEGWLKVVPSHLPHLRELCLEWSSNVRDDYVEELVAAAPELKVKK